VRRAQTQADEHGVDVEFTVLDLYDALVQHAARVPPKDQHYGPAADSREIALACRPQSVGTTSETKYPISSSAIILSWST
jgi:hypothetical protein